ncbi:MAG TPA: hypothetical protein VIU93_07655 [Gallionellaceae bacterium]
MLAARTLSVNISCPPDAVYGFVVNPENLPSWAGGLCQSVDKSAAGWIVHTPQGDMSFRFAEKNPFGVLDHYVTPAQGGEIHVPMRVLPNGSGSILLFTLFQLPGMSDDDFARDAQLVETDLLTLKRVLEARFG